MFRQRRLYATKSPYSTLYSGTFPAMVPAFLLGSAVYYVCHFVPQVKLFNDSLFLQGLQLTRSKLSHEKYMQEARQQVLALEAEIDVLQQNRATTDASSKRSSRWW